MPGAMVIVPWIKEVDRAALLPMGRGERLASQRWGRAETLRAVDTPELLNSSLIAGQFRLRPGESDLQNRQLRIDGRNVASGRLDLRLAEIGDRLLESSYFRLQRGDGGGSIPPCRRRSAEAGRAGTFRAKAATHDQFSQPHFESPLRPRSA
jgi:hypothetical protein